MFEIYELDSTRFFTVPELAWQATLKKTKVKLVLLTAINMISIEYQLCGWIKLQKLPVNGFKWVDNTSQFNEDFIINYNEESDERYFLEVDVQYPKKLHEFYNDLPFLPEKMKIEKIGKIIANVHDKKEYVIHIGNLKQALNHRLVLKKCVESLNSIRKRD